MTATGPDSARLEHEANRLLRQAGGRTSAPEYPFYSESQLRRRREQEVPEEAARVEEEWPHGSREGFGSDETVQDVLTLWLMPLGLAHRDERILEMRATGRPLWQIAKTTRKSPQGVLRELHRLSELLRPRLSGIRLSYEEAIVARGMARAATTLEIACDLGLGLRATRRVIRKVVRKMRTYRAEEARAIRQCYWEDVHRDIYQSPARLRLRVVTRALPE